MSSLQEVLELAFSVLYESDEYLNFIAPDKHEVRCAGVEVENLTVVCVNGLSSSFLQLFMVGEKIKP